MRRRGGLTCGFADTLSDWRARLVADGGGLENRYECKLIKGSNPLPSASADGWWGRFRSRELVAVGHARRAVTPMIAIGASLGTSRGPIMGQ
jgi:hypothetical protein